MIFRRSRPKPLFNERGGAALEYVLVSAFATALSLAALAIVGRLAKDELSKIAEHYGLNVDTTELDQLTP